MSSSSARPISNAHSPMRSSDTAALRTRSRTAGSGSGAAPVVAALGDPKPETDAGLNCAICRRMGIAEIGIDQLDEHRDADLLVEGYRPGTMARWGLAYDDLADDMAEAFRIARATDPLSAFGGVIAANRPVDAALTRLLSRRIAGVPVDRAPGAPTVVSPSSGWRPALAMARSRRPSTGPPSIG